MKYEVLSEPGSRTAVLMLRVDVGLDVATSYHYFRRLAEGGREDMIGLAERLNRLEDLEREASS